jgi:hypothetical protein
MQGFMNTGKEPQPQGPSRASGATSPAKKIGFMIKSPPDAPVRMLVTPELAAVMLGYNTNNRPASSATASYYARQMADGEWRETFAPIQFSGDRLVDGQHRLMAIIESGVAIPMWVGFGVDDEAFGYIDIGRKRTAGDIFSINGVPNATLVAAAVRWIHAYEHGHAAFNYGGEKYKPIKDPAPLFRYFETLNQDRVQIACKAGQWFGHNRVPCPAVATACHYICAGKNAAQADAFFRKVADGVGFKSKSEPEYKLREKLVSRTSIPTRSQVFAFIVLAWNATRQNKRIGNLVHEGGKLPRAV